MNKELIIKYLKSTYPNNYNDIINISEVCISNDTILFSIMTDSIIFGPNGILIKDIERWENLEILKSTKRKIGNINE